MLPVWALNVYIVCACLGVFTIIYCEMAQYLAADANTS